MKKYINYSKKFYVNAVKYFYSCDTFKDAEKLLVKMTPEDFEYLETLILEFRNDRFFERMR